MFDYISVLDPLPFTDEMKSLGLDSIEFFQTKDLDCSLSNYFIQGGKLFQEDYKINEWVEGDPKAESVMDKIGYMKREEPFLKQCFISQYISFYEYLDNVQGKWDCWVEFKAHVKDGVVISCELSSFEKKDNKERKQREKELENEWERIDSLWYNKYIFHTRFWRFLRRKITFGLYKIARFCDALSIKIP